MHRMTQRLLVYASTHSALHHNLLRMSQIHCNLMIIDHCHSKLQSSGHTSKTAIADHLSTAEATVRRVASDICASIPQLADYLDVLDLQHCVFDTSCHMNTPHQAITTLPELSPFLLYDPVPVESDEVPPRAEGSRKPKPETLYHAFWALSSLLEISFLEEELKDWMQGRLHWIEANSLPCVLNKLRSMKRDIKGRINLGLYKL